MTRLRHLLLLLVLVGPIHIGEQLLTGIDEFYMLRGLIERYHGMFNVAFADHASVILITAVVTLVSLMIYAAILGGRAALLVVAFFGLLGVGELHHVFEALLTGRYDPGLVTCFAYIAIGALTLKEIVKLWMYPDSFFEAGKGAWAQ